MKKTLTIISFAFIAVGCSEKESPAAKPAPRINEQADKPAPRINEQADKPAPRINEQADKLPEEPTAKSLTSEEAFEVLRTGLSGITVDKSNKTSQIFADTSFIDYPSVSFVSRVPPDFPTDKTVADQNMRRIEFCIEGESEKQQLVMYQGPLHKPWAELEPKRWILGPEIDTFGLFFWSDKVDDWIIDWNNPNSLPSRLKVELSFKRADGIPASIDEILSCEVFSPDFAKEILAEAEKGDAKAQRNLGMMYFNGNQVKKDNKAAAKWWHKSAAQGNASAQLHLALLHIKGMGIPKDILTGYAWLYIAGNNGAGNILGENEPLYLSLTDKNYYNAKKKVERIAEDMIRMNPKLVNKK